MCSQENPIYQLANSCIPRATRPLLVSVNRRWLRRIKNCCAHSNFLTLRQHVGWARKWLPIHQTEGYAYLEYAYLRYAYLLISTT